MAITERGKDKYQIDIIIGYDSNGKRVRHIETFNGKKKEAEARQSEIKALIKKGAYTKLTNMTFNNFIDIWWNDYALKELSPKTLEVNNSLLKRIKSNLGFHKLKELSPIFIKKFYNDLKDKGLTPNTICHYYTLIGSILSFAVQMEYIDRNPNASIKKPQLDKKEAPFYNMEQVQDLLGCLQMETIKRQAIILLALDTGARRGEITGLEWEDINFEKCTITINKVTQVVERKIIEKDKPKNNSSIRTIDITQNTINILKQYQMEQNNLKIKLGNKWGNSKKVFTTNEGYIMYPDTPSKILNSIIKKYHLPPIHFHSLRHISASMQLMSVEAKDYIRVSKRIGHSSITTTLNTYAHVIKNNNGDIINAMNSFFNSVKAKENDN
jgi:integrase